MFLCKEYHVIPTDDDANADGGPAMASETPSKQACSSLTADDLSPSKTPTSEEEDVNEELEVTAYFWQGRDAGPMPWLVFSYTVSRIILARV